MATVTEIIESIYNRWDSELSGTIPNSTRANEEYTPPADTAWARLSVLENLSQQATLGPVGSREYRRNGTFLIELFAPANAGTKQLDDWIQSIRSSFEGVEISSTRVFFTSVDRQVMGPRPGRWYQINAEAEFFYHEQR